MADKSSQTLENLPETEIREDTLVSEGLEGTEGLSTEVEGQELDDKTKQGFQRLIAKKDVAIKNYQAELEAERLKNEQYERERLDRERAEMSEVERLRVEKSELESKVAQSELRSFVTAELTRRNLMSNPLAQDIIESPWLLRAVKVKLPVGATWQQTIDAVHAYLPAYLDTLAAPAKSVEPQNTPTTPVEPESPVVPMDTERTVPDSSLRSKRVWTRREISELSKNPAEYQKHQAEITLALAEGRVVE